MPQTPLDTFRIGQARAEFLYKMAHGLTDRGTPAVAVNWNDDFKNLMGWAPGDVIQRVDCRDAVLVLRNGATLTQPDFAATAIDDLLRAALVMSVSAMDAYFHAKVLRHVVAHSKVKEPEPALLNRRLTVADFVAARKKQRRNSALAAAIARQMSFESLQQPGNISSAVLLIGVGNFWALMAANLGRPEADIRADLTAIVKRRNQIAHEADVSQSKKAKNRPRPVSPADIRAKLTFVEQLVTAADAVIDANMVI